MTRSIGWKHLALWMAMLLTSIANGAVRDLLYAAWMSERDAHQLSTAIGIVVLGAMIRAFLRRFPPASLTHALLIGLFWAALTVAFEFLFFHFVIGHSWAALLANYDLAAGRVWVLVVLWIGIAPCVFYPARR